MLDYCTNYTATMPDIVVYLNCDTTLAINLRIFNLGENDEFIFAIKNYSYIESPYVFLFKARASDIDENGEVIFKITPAASKRLKPGAFYNFAMLHNAFDSRRETEYKKLTENGRVILEYGAQDILVKEDAGIQDGEVIGMRLELTDAITEPEANKYMGTIANVRLEPAEE